MNEHERDRIAAALNQLRPDWPVKQLRTLIGHPQMADRPRRDVTVALAWVACESASASPYRVLESGPWWRAVAVDGESHRPLNRGPWCTTCGASRDQHRAVDHEFTDRKHEKRSPGQMRQIVQATKAELAPTTIAEPEELTVREHDTCEEAINAALARGDDGRAEFLATRCDIEHGEQAAAVATIEGGTDE